MQTFIADTADVVFKHKKTGKVVFTAEAQLAGITGGEESEIIRGGIGNKALYTVNHSKEVGLSVRNATFSLEYLAMTQGVSIENDKATVTEVERLTAEDGKVNIKGKPKDNTVQILGINGEFKNVEVEGSEIDVSDVAKNGEVVQVSYGKEIEGRTIILDATKFSENYEVEYKTIEYNTETNEVVRDIYFIFHNASPSGEYEINLENGEAYTPELEFNAMAEANSNEIGRVVEVDRNKDENNNDKDGNGEEENGDGTP